MVLERLGEFLVKSGVLGRAQLEYAERESTRTRVRLGRILVDHGLVDEVVLYDALAQVLNVDRFDLRTAILDRQALNLIDAKYALDKWVLPFRLEQQNRAVHVAFSRPDDVTLIDEVTFRTGYRVKVHVASETEIERVVRHHFHREPLNRDPRSVGHPSGRRATGDLESGTVSIDLAELTAQPREVSVADMMPIWNAQDDSAKLLRSLFEICVARGLITREEYLERLKRA